MEKGKKTFVEWISEHQREILLGGTIVLTAGSVVALIAALSNVKPAKYSMEWIRSLSPEEWKIEREIVRKQYCSPPNKIEGARLQQLLWCFDSVKREMEPPIVGPIYTRAREHGWNLYKPD